MAQVAVSVWAQPGLSRDASSSFIVPMNPLHAPSSSGGPAPASLYTRAYRPESRGGSRAWSLLELRFRRPADPTHAGQVHPLLWPVRHRKVESPDLRNSREDDLEPHRGRRILRPGHYLLRSHGGPPPRPGARPAATPGRLGVRPAGRGGGPGGGHFGLPFDADLA